MMIMAMIMMMMNDNVLSSVHCSVNIHSLFFFPRLFSYSDDDSESPKKIHSDMNLAELNQSLRMSLPRPKSGEFRKLFEGNSP